MTDHYQYWRDCLSGRDVAHPLTPQAGRYRMPASMSNRSKNSTGTWEPNSPPVAIWPDAGGLHIRIGKSFQFVEGTDKFLEFADSGWRSCNAVSAEHYQQKIETGSWHDESAAVTADHQRGRNAPDVVEGSFEDLKGRITDLESEARALIEKGAATSKEAADKAADLKNRLSELSGKAEKARVEEKEPHLKAGREVDAKWRTLTDLADIYKRIAAVVIQPFAAAEQKRRDEANKAAAFEALTTGARPEEVAATQLPPVRFGTRGRGTGLRNVKHAKITDQDALYKHFREHADVIEVLQKLANASAKSGIVVPGMEIEKDTVAV